MAKNICGRNISRVKVVDDDIHGCFVKDSDSPAPVRQDVAGLIIGQAAMADRRGARSDRWIERIDIDRNVDPLPAVDVSKRSLCALGPHLAKR